MRKSVCRKRVQPFPSSSSSSSSRWLMASSSSLGSSSWSSSVSSSSTSAPLWPLDVVMAGGVPVAVMLPSPVAAPELIVISKDEDDMDCSSSSSSSSGREIDWEALMAKSEGDSSS